MERSASPLQEQSAPSDIEHIAVRLLSLRLQSGKSRDVKEKTDKPKARAARLPLASSAPKLSKFLKSKRRAVLKLVHTYYRLEEERHRLEHELSQLRVKRLQLEDLNKRSAQRRLTEVLNQSQAKAAADLKNQKTIAGAEMAALSTAVNTAQALKPYIQLPTFHGNPREWLTFRDAYTVSAAHYNDDENLERLRSSLMKQAREAVLGLLQSKASPNEVLQMLEFYFGQPHTIALAELDRLRTLRLYNNGESISEFAKEVYTVSMTLLKLEGEYYLCPKYIQVIVQKMPCDMRVRWHRYYARQLAAEPKLLQVARFLQEEAYYRSSDSN